ncbi:exonuclease RecJ [Halostella litorea]|uniref:exonuclease RecJ n=1 Tax=Halostella litorea TaxID=2528831 RepID=UPI00109281E2|nr:exonuclease RecJ [Halostella litorea]
MSTTGRTATAAPDALAATLREAPFVRVLAAADGDSVAAAGVVARALDCPFQVSVTRTAAERERRAATAEQPRDAAATLVVGDDADGPAIAGRETPASVTAVDVARELGASADPVLALAGVAAAGGVPGAGESASVLAAAEERGLVERRPGVAVPVADLADGLAHTTLAHADFSGDPTAAGAALAELDLPADLDDGAYSTVASLVALSASGGERATPRAAEAVERALRPYATPESPFATVSGYADVLATTAEAAPGTAVAAALGHDVRDAALDAWRDAAERAHRALREATTGRYDGLFVARHDAAPVATTARLLQDFRSPEPVALVVGDGEAAAAAVEDRGVGAAMRAGADAVGGEAGGDARTGYVRFDSDQDDGAASPETKEFIAAFREAL